LNTLREGPNRLMTIFKDMVKNIDIGEVCSIGARVRAGRGAAAIVASGNLCAYFFDLCKCVQV
jgi:hypothetical protein